MNPPPIVGITAGDPCGVGPEVLLKALREPRGEDDAFVPLVLGDQAAFLAVAQPGELVPVSTPEDARTLRSGIALLEVGALESALPLGAVCAEAGAASFAYVERAIEEMRSGAIAAVVTAPIAKEAWALAGHGAWPGHTELFAERFDSPDAAMLLTSPRLSVALVTVHQSLASVPTSLTAERIVEVGALLDVYTRHLWPKRSGPLAVLGLNPHAGENGLFGDEESRIVAPAVAHLRARGIDAVGPLPPDTAFTPEGLARWRGYLCLYHDQGLIPFKLVAFADGVNVTMGLRGGVRTSPDHGTAFGIAGTDRADARSTREALRLAARLARES